MKGGSSFLTVGLTEIEKDYKEYDEPLYAHN